MAFNFAPVFSTIFDSSVWQEPYHVRLLWLTLLCLKDKDQVVRGYDYYKLARRANITPEEAAEGLEVLSSPDRFRTDQPFDGRRIEEVAAGCWRILNGATYQMHMVATLRRAYKAAKQREYRMRKLQEAGG